VLCLREEVFIIKLPSSIDLEILTVFAQSVVLLVSHQDFSNVVLSQDTIRLSNGGCGYLSENVSVP
jgi:hypothetical protein